MFAGRAIQLCSRGRDDLLRTKLFALCDRCLDLADCVALAPIWLEEQDLNPNWPARRGAAPQVDWGGAADRQGRGRKSGPAVTTIRPRGSRTEEEARA